MQSIRSTNEQLSECRLCGINGHHKIDIWNENTRATELTLSGKISESIGVLVGEFSST